VWRDFWTVYNTANSDLPDNWVRAIAIDHDGAKWFGTGGGVARFDGTTWTVYNTSNSGLPNDHVYAIAVDIDGSKWFGTEPEDGGVARFDGATWTVYDSANSGLPYGFVIAITIDHNGAKWFGTDMGDGVARFDGATWTVYNPTNSGLPNGSVYAIASDRDGHIWFGTAGGAASFDGTTWTVYDTSNSGLPGNWVEGIAVDRDGRIWFGIFGGVAACFDGSSWTVYSFGFPDSDVLSVAIDRDNKWFSASTEGAIVLWGGEDYLITDNTQWLDESHWRATYDITSLVPRGDYTIEVSGARGSDGLEIPTDTRFGFTVDYAGEISDKTAPPPPHVLAGGVEGDPSTVAARWSASDPESAITGYRYAIGSAAGAVDIVNWTTTTATSLTRSGLGLVDGHQYWFAVQARNQGGLWSAAASSRFVAGQPTSKVYLPLILRRR